MASVMVDAQTEKVHLYKPFGDIYCHTSNGGTILPGCRDDVTCEECLVALLAPDAAAGGDGETEGG